MSNQDETPEYRLRKELPDEVPVTASEDGVAEKPPSPR